MKQINKINYPDDLPIVSLRQEIIDAVMQYQYATGPNGLPGNNDSGALTSWYVLNAIGEFPLIETLIFPMPHQ